MDAEQLITEGSSILETFRQGAHIKVYYESTGQFSVTNKKTTDKKASNGDLTVARLVKGVNGKGITVQTAPTQFGFIEMAEITDDLVGSVIDTLS